jgi:hypothetical protein
LRPTRSTGPWNSVWRVGSSGAFSTRGRNGMLTRTVSPGRQVRKTAKLLPGAEVPYTGRPLTVTRNPEVTHAGTRSRSAKVRRSVAGRSRPEDSVKREPEVSSNRYLRVGNVLSGIRPHPGATRTRTAP